MTHLLVTLAAFRDALDALAAEVTARLDGHAPDSPLPLEGSAPAGSPANDSSGPSEGGCG